ncbi:hypothetical protein HKX48_002667 [Thoreauomyces humboldtii]|nr:hypothetical protein HKX48_002667 [Thoreauomyces humboldtii]
MPADQKTAGGGRNRFKISLTAVLNEEHEFPFSLANFEKYVMKEHSEENLEFYHALTRYRTQFARHFPNCISNLRSSRRGNTGSNSSMRSISSACASTNSLSQPSSSKPVGSSSETASEEVLTEQPTTEDDRRKMKDECERIQKLYLEPGSEKEINLPATLRKKVMIEIKDKGNHHPDVFKHCLEHVYLLMKTSSYPNFYRECVVHLKTNNLPMPEKSGSREMSLERRVLSKSNLAMRDASVRGAQ